ncbi:RBBP8 N-terminal-like protein isoform X2 [Takifugu flavidus]|uniref:RBBP8 N-terminal-like protein isoform X2 n=1 Tax=Takifugu flavidus TaxID=433684 RepID=UPI002544C80F|nr:RBBP8 N-terminal-like protein isoform X2 [Takifugu flavidus]
MECFNSLLLKVREAHEREVEGWQVKIQELSNKKGCDTRRMEELFSKNQQMKEQQRLLTENIKTLENRLRAGLCDRCSVTQDFAKRRQQEFEASHLQSLQHISLMAGEMNTLKKENKRLKEENKVLKAALHEQSSNTSELTLTSSPDLSPSSGPVPLIATATSKPSKQPPDGDDARKAEVDHRKDELEQRQWKSSSRRYFESYKPLPMPPNRKCDASLSYSGERRPPSAEALDQQPLIFPQSLLVKNSTSGEVKPSRHGFHVPLPCRPQPIKGSAVSLPWSSPPVNSLMMSPSPKSNMTPFPNLATAESLHPGLMSVWHRQEAPKLNTTEQTVLFRLRSLPEHAEAQRNTVGKKEKPACWTERISAEAPKEVYEGPLDLSDRGRSTSPQSPRDYSPTALPDAEPTQNTPDLKTEPSAHRDISPSISLNSPLQEQEEEPAADCKSQVSKEQKELHGMKEQSSDKKAPVFTISLHPVVVLETLNSALQKQGSLNDESAAAESENSQEEQDIEQEGHRSCKRKRSTLYTESDPDTN